MNTDEPWFPSRGPPAPRADHGRAAAEKPRTLFIWAVRPSPDHTIPCVSGSAGRDEKRAVRSITPGARPHPEQRVVVVQTRLPLLERKRWTRDRSGATVAEVL